MKESYLNRDARRCHHLRPHSRSVPALFTGLRKQSLKSYELSFVSYWDLGFTPYCWQNLGISYSCFLQSSAGQWLLMHLDVISSVPKKFLSGTKCSHVSPSNRGHHEHIKPIFQWCPLEESCGTQIFYESLQQSLWAEKHTLTLINPCVRAHHSVDIPVLAPWQGNHIHVAEHLDERALPSTSSLPTDLVLSVQKEQHTKSTQKYQYL